MADKKISQLTASSTPLDGTEVLPIVQSGTTKQVSVSSLTSGRAINANSFTPSSNTVPTNGMYLPTANVVGFSTNSTYAMEIDSLQQMFVGMTTANVTYNKMSVLGNSLAFHPSADNNTNGIGCCINGTTLASATSASAKLYMTGANGAHAGCLELRSGSVVGSSIDLYNTSGTKTFSYGTSWLQHTTNASSGYNSAIVNSWGNSSNAGILVGTTRTDGYAFQVGTNIALTSNLPSSNGTTAFLVFGSGGVSIGDTTDPGATNLSVSGQIYSNSGYGSVAAEYGCRAWVNMNCTGTPSIRGSGNITSVSSLGTGYFGVTLTNAMPDRNYCAVVSAGYHQGTTTTSYTTLDQYGNNTTSIIKFYAQDVGGSGYAPDWACLTVFR